MHIFLHGWDQLHHANVIKWAKAKVHVNSDSVLCLGKMFGHPEANARWEDQLNEFQQSNAYRELFGSMQNRTNSSGIFPRNHNVGNSPKDPRETGSLFGGASRSGDSSRGIRERWAPRGGVSSSFLFSWKFLQHAQRILTDESCSCQCSMTLIGHTKKILKNVFFFSNSDKNYAKKRLPRGHWSFLGPGEEEKWFGTHIYTSEGQWNNTADDM